jgi:hypothetical protein
MDLFLISNQKLKINFFLFTYKNLYNYIKSPAVVFVLYFVSVVSVSLKNDF